MSYFAKISFKVIKSIDVFSLMKKLKEAFCETEMLSNYLKENISYCPFVNNNLLKKWNKKSFKKYEAEVEQWISDI